MKTFVLIVFSLLATLSVSSQGIQFETGTWAEVLEKARQTNKPVFVDVYTTWCGPCKKMSKDIFTLPEVGDVFNKNYVCYKLDAENGEGREIAKKYEVKSYPTYLFVKADGELFYRSVGSMPAQNFIAESDKAMVEMNDPKPMSMWEKEYADKKNDPAFLLAYMEKRSRLGKSNTELFDAYLNLLPADQRTSDKVVEIYKQISRELQINSLAYNNLTENKTLFASRIPGLENCFLAALSNSYRIATKEKNEQLLEQVVAEYDKLGATPKKITKEELYLNYYKGTGNKEKYISSATDYCDKVLMVVSPDSIAKSDQKKLLAFTELIKQKLVPEMDSIQLKKTKQYLATADRNKYSQALNDVAWNFFERVSDKDILKNALRWSARSLEIYPESPMLMDTYANLLYRLGKRKEAIEMEKKALDMAVKTNSDKKVYEETLRKMEAREQTWK
jgi:thioredoxin-related protein